VFGIRAIWQNSCSVCDTLSVWLCFVAEFVVVVVYVCVCAGHTWNIPDSVMSLTLIAAGSSVPDAIASLIVVRDGMMPTLLLGHRVK